VPPWLTDSGFPCLLSLSRRPCLTCLPAGFALVILCALAVMPVAAQPVVNPHEQLDEIETQIRDNASRINALRKSADKHARDAKVLREQLILAAGNAQARERTLSSIEQRLAALETQEAAAVARLQAERLALGELLAVLQRMGREPPPALVIRPDDATAAARSAMLLSAIVPGAQTKAKYLAARLDSLRRLRQEAAQERLKAAEAVASLEKDRHTLTQLLAQRRALMAQTMDNLEATRSRVQSLADEASDLRALLASLSEDERRPHIRGRGPAIIKQIAAVGASKSVPLDRLRGRLRWPANGKLVARFGGQDNKGGRLQGIYLETLPGSAVTAPSDGKIMFAGAFPGYGQMLIISAEGGYHIVLAGLSDVDGVVGQVVLAGEPLGRMGRSGSLRRSAGAGLRGPAGEENRRLYIEFRRNDAPVDPVPWFASLKERVSG
jgi:septal ring factor EnvC (AmiA/AmiB activator)